MKKLLMSLFLSLSLFARCSPSGTLGIDIIGDIDFNGVLPIKIAGIPIIKGSIPDMQGAVSSPICVCPAPPPKFFFLGITVSFFEPSRLIEVVRDPFCFPLMGFELPKIMRTSKGTKGEGEARQRTFKQAHYYYFPLFALLELMEDFICLAKNSFDIAYMSEIDPMWNNDSLSFIIQPEALLFANPISHFICFADSIASQMDRPIDMLFWCKGAWGTTYPLTGNTATKSYVEDGASIAGNLIYSLHRKGLLWAGYGNLGLCSYYYAPIWRKSAYRLQLVNPVAHPKAMTIGKAGIQWTYMKNPPTKGDNFGYLLFRKRDCCVPIL